MADTTSAAALEARMQGIAAEARIAAMVEGLRARLAAQPGDAEDWLMLS